MKTSPGPKNTEGQTGTYELKTVQFASNISNKSFEILLLPRI